MWRFYLFTNKQCSVFGDALVSISLQSFEDILWKVWFSQDIVGKELTVKSWFGYSILQSVSKPEIIHQYLHKETQRENKLPLFSTGIESYWTFRILKGTGP